MKRISDLKKKKNLIKAMKTQKFFRKKKKTLTIWFYFNLVVFLMLYKLKLSLKKIVNSSYFK